MISGNSPIPFARPASPVTAIDYVGQVLRSGMTSGDHAFTRRCTTWLTEHGHQTPCLLTTSGTHALELAALVAGIQPGDEVILPSFTFSSTANAFVLRGASLVFVDVDPRTMNLDPKSVSDAITPKTRVILPVHYGGVSCDMDALLKIARDRNILVIEDAAQGLMASHEGRPLGTIGDFGCLSFHETKNISCGEGGALYIGKNARAKDGIQAAEIIREKGTDRSRFFRGQVDKYTWVSVGSSFLPSDVLSALLYSQLEIAENITRDRVGTWERYRRGLDVLYQQERIELQEIPRYAKSNGHIFYLKARSLEERSQLIAYLRELGIGSAFHYVPLHSSEAGRKFGRFAGEDRHTTRDSERLVRLPIFYGMQTSDTDRVIESVIRFFRS